MENKMNTLEDLVRIIRILRSENGSVRSWGMC